MHRHIHIRAHIHNNVKHDSLRLLTNVQMLDNNTHTNTCTDIYIYVHTYTTMSNMTD